MISIAHSGPAPEALAWEDYARMKKSANLLLVFLGLVIFSCSLFSPKTGDREGFEIYFSTNPDNIKSITSTRDVSLVQPRETYYPKNGALGFARFWFPTSETYNVLKTKGTLENGIIPLKAEDLSGLVFYKAIEKSNEKPLVLDAASGEPYKPEIDLPYGALYKGLVIEYVFLQIEMDDYKLRYYHQDSGKYKAGDILIDLNNDNKDWQYIYNKRVLTFDFKNPQDKSECIENIRSDIRLYLTDQRKPTGMYYENWKYEGDKTKNASYIYDFLYKLDKNRLDNYATNPKDKYENETLVQLFRLSPDVPMGGSGNTFEAAMGEDTYLRNAGNGQDFGGNPMLIVNYGPGATLDKPYTIETFPEDANEAKMYKLELVYSLGNSDHGTDGLTIQVPVDGWNDADTPLPAWNDLENFGNEFGKMLNIRPSCGGIGARFGWLDFNGDWQGEFSSSAGH
jgi:hypothetical protein